MAYNISNGSSLKGRLAALATAAILATSATAVLVHDDSKTKVVSGDDLVANLQGEQRVITFPQINNTSGD